MNTITMGLIVLFFGCPSLPHHVPTPKQDSELSILEHYEGIWDCDFTIEPTSEGGSPQRFTGVVEGKWVVGDKFLEQTGRYQLSKDSSPLVIKTLMTFDKSKSRYQYDYFNSSGEVHRSYGKWNSGSKSMTSTLEDENGTVSTIVAEFGSPGVEHWSIEIEDRDGKVTAKLIGTNTKRKEK